MEIKECLRQAQIQADKRDYDIATYMVRDHPFLKEHDLSDLAWAMHHDCNLCKADWDYLAERILFYTEKGKGEKI